MFSLCHRQEVDGDVECTRLNLGRCCSQCALAPAHGVDGECCGTLEKGCGCADSAACLGPVCRAVEFCGDVIIGAGRRVGQMPGATVGIQVRVGGRR